MLSYVFWHWHRPEVDPVNYEKCLCGFHEVLFENKPDGFHHSRVLRTEQAPWIGRSGRTYEDWNTVESSAVLDTLNEQAVSGPCEQPHEQIARLTMGSAAGLYRLAFGTASLPVVRFVYRFDKPRGVEYRIFLNTLESFFVESDVALWARQMNLGPGAEFCLQTARSVELPKDQSAGVARVDQVCFTLPRQ